MFAALLQSDLVSNVLFQECKVLLLLVPSIDDGDEGMHKKGFKEPLEDTESKLGT